MPSPQIDGKKVFFAAGLLLLIAITVAAAWQEQIILVIGGVLALAGGIYLYKKPELATLVFVCVFYSNAAVLAYQFHGVPQIVAAAVPLVLGLPLAYYVFVRREGLVFDRVLLLMFIYLVTLILATLAARDVLLGLNEIGNYFLEGMVLYFLVLNVIRSLTTLQRVFWALVLVCGLLGALSIYQELTHTYDKNYLGFAQRKKSIDFDELDYEVYSGAKRAEGPVGEQNRYAQLMVVILPIGLYLFMTERAPRRKWLALIATGLTFSGVLLTFSRGTFLALGLVFFLIMCLGYIRPRHALAGGLALAAAVAIALPDYVNRVAGLADIAKLQTASSDTRSLDGSLRGRFAQNLAALYVFADYPLLGVGPAHFSKFYVRTYGNAIGTKYLRGERRAHNMYLEQAANTGMIGFAAFMAVVLFILWRLWRARQHFRLHQPRLANLATAFGLSIICYLTTAIFLHLSYQRYYWFLLALAGAALQVLTKAAAEVKLAATPSPAAIAEPNPEVLSNEP
jgi:drug/metabolite transporter (DMT)-like permease